MKDLQLIFNLVKNYFIGNEEFNYTSRKQEYVLIRQFYCYLAKINTPHSLSKIGSIIKRDHATVIHSNKEIMDKLFVDSIYRRYNKDLNILSKEIEILVPIDMKNIIDKYLPLN